MSTPTLITSRDPKGQRIIDLVAAVLNKSKLDDDRAQRLIENGGEFQSGLRSLIEQYSASNRFADQEVKSNCGYPEEYRVRPLAEQVDILAGLFKLSLGDTIEFIEKTLPTLTLPEGAEDYFAIPSIDAVAARFFPDVKDPAEKYCRAVNLVLEMLAKSRKFTNYRAGELTPDRFRQHVRTVQALETISETQTGDILIIPCQFGLRYRGKSVNRARELFRGSEFGLGAFATGCMELTHPEREVHWEQLHPDCPGDEFSPDADGQFDSAPIFFFHDGQLRFPAGWVSYAHAHYGSASGFIPQQP